MQEKADLRKVMLTKRDALPEADKHELDKKINAAIMDVVTATQPRVVHCYIPMGSEIDIKPVINHLLDNKVTVIAPKALKKRQLQNLVLHSLQELEDGIYGTQHPAGGNEYNGPIDLFIIPGLAFDRNNYRLGYGSGYYDTFLHNEQNAYRLGICYPFQVVDTVPTEPHDEQLSAIVY